MKDVIIKELKKSLIKLNYYHENINISISIPKNKSFGDLSTNISLLLSEKLKKSPLDIANDIKEDLDNLDLFKKISVARPGFLNFNLNSGIITNQLKEIILLENNYGKNDTYKNKKGS